MLVGSLVVSRISSKWATWSAMIALLAVHLGTNYLAVRAVSMRTLNRQRANLVFSNYFEKIDKEVQPKKGRQVAPIQVPTPEEISVEERVFERDGILRWQGGKALGFCRMGIDLQTILNLFGEPNQATGSYTSTQLAIFEKLLELYKDDEYIMWYDVRRKTFLVVLRDTATVTTQLSAWMHALFHAQYKGVPHIEDYEALMRDLRSSKQHVSGACDRYDIFGQLQKAGWDIETGAMETVSGTRIKVKESNS